LGKLIKGVFFLRAQTLSANSNSIPFPQHYLPTHKCLFRSLTLSHVADYSQATRVLTPFFPAPTSFDTTSVFTTLHPKLNGYFPFFFKDYEPN